MMVELPPVEANLLGFVDRADQQADTDRQQLAFRERHLYVACNDQPFVEDAIEDVDQTCRSPVPLTQWRRHRMRILRTFARARCSEGLTYLSKDRKSTRL